jgi:hypothetical protein
MYLAFHINLTYIVNALVTGSNVARSAISLIVRRKSGTR